MEFSLLGIGGNYSSTARLNFIIKPIHQIPDEISIFGDTQSSYGQGPELCELRCPWVEQEVGPGTFQTHFLT